MTQLYNQLDETVKAYVDKRKQYIPKNGDRYVVIGVYPNTTDDLMRSRTEVVLKLEKDTKGEQK